MSFEQETIYYVSSEEDPTVLLGIDVRLTEHGVEWFDTVRDRVFPLKDVKNEGRTVIVETEEATYRFEPLTLELYLDHVADNVAGNRVFVSTEELQQYYQEFPR